ncbi:lipoprotein [Parvibaculum sp.]|jgi:predicted small lipoprotein YifL|uniref:LPS translocon maturation chaperone LptM n=1 Tax=Parvibaculum sp. TaxID=2024848 RepID=UPI0025D21897|nr:lipoprotein [Parvibaculum sp.]|tara:strand:- start:7076 stop:7312 length:237 start_codon:yes stop_codon:yes gene_type:complete
MTIGRTIMTALLGLALAATLSACGRKGDPELPAGAKPRPAAEQGPSAQDVLGDNPPVAAEPLHEEMEDIAPRSRVSNY